FLFQETKQEQNEIKKTKFGDLRRRTKEDREKIEAREGRTVQIITSFHHLRLSSCELSIEITLC
ncbi:hypothetical protein QHH03_32015, partial [Aphanizomenon sp. 202]|nr:hypothetical protein [Aphanizomenon sp. 202]